MIVAMVKICLKGATLYKTYDPFASPVAKLNYPIVVSLQVVVSVGDFYCLLLDFYS